MDTALSPAEAKFLRACAVAGWAIAALILAAAIGGGWFLKESRKADQLHSAVAVRAYIEKVRSCYRAARRSLTWDQCEDRVDRGDDASKAGSRRSTR